MKACAAENKGKKGQEYKERAEGVPIESCIKRGLRAPQPAGA